MGTHVVMFKRKKGNNDGMFANSAKYLGMEQTQPLTLSCDELSALND